MAKKYKPGDTRKSKTGQLLRLSSSGKWFKSSNSPAADRQRKLNARLNAPIADLPGTPYKSATTERQLAHQADAATQVQFGASDQALKQSLAQAVQHQQNVGSYYDDYRAQLAQLRDQAVAYNQGAAAAMQGLPGMVTGLAQQTQGQVQQNQAARGPEMGAIGAATTNTDASNAAAISQAAAGGYAAQQNLIGQSNLNYANNLLNNVEPAQRIQALQNTQGGITEAQGNITAQAKTKGAYNADYRQTKRDDETKNLLASATLGLNAQKAADANANADATRRSNAAAKKATLKQSMKAEANRHAEAIARAKTDRDRLAETKRHNREMAKLRKGAKGTDVKPATGPGSISSSAENSVVGKVNQLTQLMKHSVWPGGPRKGKPMTAEEVRHHYQAQGVDDNIIHLAYSLYKNKGKVGPDGIRAAHALGIHVNGRWGKVGGSSTYVKPPKPAKTGSRGDG